MLTGHQTDPDVLMGVSTRSRYAAVGSGRPLCAQVSMGQTQTCPCGHRVDTGVPLLVSIRSRQDPVDTRQTSRFLLLRTFRYTSVGAENTRCAPVGVKKT